MTGKIETEGDVIRLKKSADDWAEGFPIGNGRIGAMISGNVAHDRISLNDDLLWRRFWTFQKHDTAKEIKELQRLCRLQKWEDAHRLLLGKIPVSGHAVYLNPFVPVGDLGLRLYHGGSKISDYERRLNMATGIAEVDYQADGVRFSREYFCSWVSGVLVIRLSANRASCITGSIELSRLTDPECQVIGNSRQNEVVLSGEFEEGVKFAAVSRVIQKGGRLTAGRTEWHHPEDEASRKDFGTKYVFKNKDEFENQKGASTFFDSATEVWILTAVGTDSEAGTDPAEYCRKRLDGIPLDYERLREEHIRDHQSLYGRTKLRLGGDRTVMPDSEILEHMRKSGTFPQILVEKLFNLGRYLAIASGRPQPARQPTKAPINLQGIWNQDRRPAWDCDYHLDLNLEMCYWSLDLVNLGDLIGPLADWVEKLLPQARMAAADLYGCRGMLLGCVNDFNNIGNVDDISIFWTGAAAWVAEILWKHWEFSRDEYYLRRRLYPLLREIGLFYEDFLTEDNDGHLIPCPSCSPEMGIKGRPGYDVLSSPSAMDLELLHEVFSHLLEASSIVDADEPKRGKWTEMLRRIPLPTLGNDGCIHEWAENHEPLDPGHRHRSHLVGLCPGDRITWEETPDYCAGAHKALENRHKYGLNSNASFTCAWDAQIYARLYDGDSASKQLLQAAQANMMNNLLMTINDWKNEGSGLSWFPGVKLFQIEASFGVMAAIAEMLFQDRHGLMRMLPALPDGWASGTISGLRASGGFEIGISWDMSAFSHAVVKSLSGNTCRVKIFRAKRNVTVYCRGKAVNTTNNQDVIQFDTIRGEVYEFR